MIGPCCHAKRFGIGAVFAIVTVSSFAMVHAADGVPSDDGVFVRFKLEQPQDTRYYVRIGGFIHVPNWRLPAAVLPPDAQRDVSQRVASGEYTPWFDLEQHAGDRLHERQHRAGGVAEFPNITAQFFTDVASAQRTVVIELATRPTAEGVV